MKFLADINIPQSVIIELKKLKHDVIDAKKNLLYAPDTEIIKIAKQETRIILTRDKDFIALVQYPKYQVPTIVIRLKEQTPKHILERVVELLNNQSAKILANSLTVVKEEAARSYPY